MIEPSPSHLPSSAIRKKTVTSAALLLSGLLAMSSSAPAALVFDDFSTTGALNGTMPDSTVGGSTWTALTGANGPTSNGTVLSVPTGSTQTDVLDLGIGYFNSNPAVYTLSMDVTMPSGSATNWLGLGFVVNPQTAGTLSSTGTAAGLNSNGGTNGGSPWMLYRQNGQVNVYRGAGTNSQLLSSATGAFPSGSTYNLKLVLNTSVSNWTLDAFMNSTQLDLNGGVAGNTATFATNPVDIRYIGFSQSGGSIGSITVDNFSLVPEPSTGILLALSGSVLLWFRRREPCA